MFLLTDRAHLDDVTSFGMISQGDFNPTVLDSSQFEKMEARSNFAAVFGLLVSSFFYLDLSLLK